MLQTTRTRLVAPGLASPTRLEALVFEPWNDLATDLATEMNRFAAAVLPANGSAPAELAWVPAVDVEEREDGIRLAFEVPGVAPDAIEITVHDGALTVSGERTFPGDANGQGDQATYRLERRYGRFARRLTLPKTVDPDRVEARYELGVLHLHLPKRPEAQPRRIAVADRARAADEPRRLDSGAAA